MFVDVSGQIASNPHRLHSGIAVSDLDADGKFEFVVAGFGGPNRVLRWSGGQLRDGAPPLIADNGSHAAGLAAGDIDGDGREELYVVNVDVVSSSGRFSDRLFKAHHDGRWEDLFARQENSGIQNRSTGRSVASIDRRGVGRYGLLVVNNDRPMSLYELGPDGSLVDLALPLGLSHAAGGRGVLTLPIFSEHPDIICTNASGSNLAFRNLGDGTFTECAAMLGLTDPEEHGCGIVAVDANNDAGLDLCWGNWEGPNRLMTRQPSGSWRDRATAGFAFPAALSTVIAADFDNDGHDEIFFNNLGEPNRLFRISTRSESEPHTSTVVMIDPGDALDPTGFGTGAAVCDIDGDGVLELLISRGEREAQPLGLFKARTAESNNWLRVMPLTRFGAPARGAVVRMMGPDRTRVKGICGGSGYQCQMEPVAHFGLGPNGSADRVHVTWPDGSAVVLMNPGTNRTINVSYPGG